MRIWFSNESHFVSSFSELFDGSVCPVGHYSTQRPVRRGCNQSFISNEITRRSDCTRGYRRPYESRESNRATSDESKINKENHMSHRAPNRGPAALIGAAIVAGASTAFALTPSWISLEPTKRVFYSHGVPPF